MVTCPTCKATVGNTWVCHRCKSDLGLVVQAKDQARYHVNEALRAYHQDAFFRMFHHARKARQLVTNPETTRLLALSCALVQEFDLALYFWKQLDTLPDQPSTD